MPIKAENMEKYPADWAERREAVLERAEVPGGFGIVRCECAGQCGTDHQTSTGRCPEVNNREPVTFLGRRVILTCAHQDHELVDHSLENLKAMCQRCHLNFDGNHRREQKRRTEEDGMGTER